MASLLENRFHLKEAGTDVKTEVLAGITTFMTMAYIIFVNPGILQNAGMPFGALMTATCLASALATFLMAFMANWLSWRLIAWTKVQLVPAGAGTVG